jgi:hypothetical protein
MIPGKTDSRGNSWVRCQECGDSRNPNKAHCMIDSRGSTYCYRCGHSSQLGVETLIDIMLGTKSMDEALEEPSPAPRHKIPNLGRATCLTKYAVEGEPDWDSFQMRNSAGDLLGWHNRSVVGKMMENEGRRGLGFVGQTLTSSPSRPLIAVEGPFDVITERHVCVYGTLSVSSLRFLPLQYVWLHPDPDQLDTEAKRVRFITKVVLPAMDRLVFVEGVIISEDDPDKAQKLVHVPVDSIWDLQRLTP